MDQGSLADKADMDDMADMDDYGETLEEIDPADLAGFFNLDEKR